MKDHNHENLTYWLLSLSRYINGVSANNTNQNG